MGVQPELRDSLFIASDNRSNFKQVLAKRSDLVGIMGGGARLAPSLNGTYQYAGLVLGLAATGADAGFLKAYNSANTDGSQKAVGVLAEDVCVDAQGNGSTVAVYNHTAYLFQDLLIGLDAGAIANLNASTQVENGQKILYIP